MCKIIWDHLTDEAKAEAKKEYFLLHEEGRYQQCKEDVNLIKAKIQQMENLFGQENLKTYQTKCWNEYIETTNYPKGVYCSIMYNGFHPDKTIITKATTAVKIAELIKVGFNGKITKDEWNDKSMIKFVIKFNPKNLSFDIKETIDDVTFLAFRTKLLAQEFIQYNLDLLQDYYQYECNF